MNAGIVIVIIITITVIILIVSPESRKSWQGSRCGFHPLSPGLVVQTVVWVSEIWDDALELLEILKSPGQGRPATLYSTSRAFPCGFARVVIIILLECWGWCWGGLGM